MITLPSILPFFKPTQSSPASLTSLILSNNSTASDIVHGILGKIPLSPWVVYLLLAVGALLVLLFCVCVCVCCCRRRRKKRRQQRRDAHVKLASLSGKTTSALVQPGAGEHSGVNKQPRGKLLYSLEFNAALSELMVGIKQASSLKAMDIGGTSDPYVKVYILPDKTKTCETKVLKNTLNAIFNEHFNFQISKATLVKSTAVLQVFDFDRFSKHDMIGELRLKLGQVDWNHVIEEWRDLEEPSTMEEENLGEICFSLRYVPTSSKLTVVILEAKNLKSTDLDGSSDPYVKVQLALDKRKWKKKKTSIKSNTLNPYYNEAFTFKVTLEQIQRVNLVISVWDHDPLTPNDPTGKIFLGCDAAGNQLRHWADMLSNPRRPVAQWHTLLSAEEVNASLTLKKKIPLVRKIPF
ncbi:synaptotagmin VIII isoform X2 [Dunckerocampus dactyliophorus]|nr:synaptotagmin VIII isoform X2 [Dunckerocampus dactyliophorus]XP_054633175.1 synaptotagmin VIII isoform X2 [Dunckerocampus dactyliophorus]XP_054633177.1 synaptotagmin VIII isoform X2 [Dunckerocampus dactyliophorus]